MDSAPDSLGVPPYPSFMGTLRHRVIVQDLAGQPLRNARVRVLGGREVRSNDEGSATLDSTAAGTQTLEVIAIGYVPERRVVNLGTPDRMADTVVLASLRSVLDTIRVIGARDPIGFERRRSAGIGQFITREDVERENPRWLTQLLRTRKGLRFTLDGNGAPAIEVTTLDSPCWPAILVDGYPLGTLSGSTGGHGPVPAAAVGEVALDWLIRPDDVGGVEIYNTPAKLPIEFAKWFPLRPCAAIVIWTRERLGLPSVKSPQR